jgi:hypothetical protein
VIYQLGRVFDAAHATKAGGYGSLCVQGLS